MLVLALWMDRSGRGAMAGMATSAMGIESPGAHPDVCRSKNQWFRSVLDLVRVISQGGLHTRAEWVQGWIEPEERWVRGATHHRNNGWWGLVHIRDLSQGAASEPGQ
eukprot:TRINITY_DN32738_c0_g1_i1.p2 TRINITY_DN32738_c0_g1~~TRINITY_DN32738_c0_g1_i1.p2  ORF type:complete len:107 (-),score=5.77 TRINITY_DN32738_c0_g1_i1:554-874(-)